MSRPRKTPSRAKRRASPPRSRGRTVPVADKKTLTALAEQINAAHERVVAGLKTSVESAIAVGELLLKAKGFVRHGNWAQWVATNTAVSERSCRGYMQLAKLDPAKRRLVADSDDGLRAMLSLVAARRPDAGATGQRNATGAKSGGGKPKGNAAAASKPATEPAAADRRAEHMVKADGEGNAQPTHPAAAEAAAAPDATKAQVAAAEERARQAETRFAEMQARFFEANAEAVAAAARNRHGASA
jgi:hypothetical protein